MPLGQRLAHMPPERRRCISDLRGELLIRAGRRSPEGGSGEIKFLHEYIGAT